MTEHRLWVAVNVALLVLVASCSSTGPCGPTTCVGGCCDSSGQCATPSDSACGTGGVLCTTCGSGQTCVLNLGVCSGGTGGGSGSGGGNGGIDEPKAPRCTPTAVTCQDQSIMQLALKTVVNSDPIVEEGTAPDFHSKIDARAGGSNPNTSYVYMSFSKTGLTQKAIDDESALASMDWDIALRRYVLRLNSGVGGPSCTEAARTPPGTSFDALTKTPAGLSWRTEIYFSAPGDAGTGCDFVPDTSGIGAPGTALSSFWTYQSCVQMTGNVYVVHLRDDRYVKLQVLSYYSAAAQTTCNATGTVPTPNEAAVVRMRWAFIAPP